MKIVFTTLGLVAVSILLASSTARADPYDPLDSPASPGNAGLHGTSLKGALALGSYDARAGWPVAGFALDSGSAVFSERGYGDRASAAGATFPTLSGADLRLAARISLRAGLPSDRTAGIDSLSRATRVPGGRMNAEHLALALAGLAVLAGVCRHRSWSLAGV
jgi:hypothetical protein